MLGYIYKWKWRQQVLLWGTAVKKLNKPQQEKKHLQAIGSLWFTFTQTFVEMIFQGTGLELFLFYLEKKRLQSWYEEEAHESSRIVAAQKKHLLFFKQEKWKRELYEGS